MSNRNQRRAIAARNTFYRVTPMIKEELEDGTDLQDQQGNISIIDTKFNDCLVALVPPTTSFDMARELEQRLIKEFKRNVIVMTDNIALCRVEGPLDKKEIAALFKGVENADPEAIAESLVHRAIVADQEKEAEDAREALGPDEGEPTSKIILDPSEHALATDEG